MFKNKISMPVVASSGGGGGNFKQLYVHKIHTTDAYDHVYIIITTDSAELIETRQKLLQALAPYLTIFYARYPASGKSSNNEPITGLAYKLNSLAYVIPIYDTTNNKILEKIVEIGSDWSISDIIVAPNKA